MDETKTECSKGNPLKSCLAAFKEHPRQAGETYTQHLAFTLKMAAKLISSGLSLLVHGIFPFLCVHTASNTIRSCHGTLDERACKTGGGSKKDAPQ